MSKLAILFWLLNVVLDTSGHVAFKIAAVDDESSTLQRWTRLLASPPLWAGIACFAIEFVMWFALISLIPLSLAVLVGSVNVAAVTLAGKWLLNERLDRARVAGITLIAIGVALAGGAA